MRTRQGKLSEKPWERVFVLKLKAIVISVLAATVLWGGQVQAEPRAYNAGKAPKNEISKPAPKPKPATSALDAKRNKVVNTAIDLMKRKQVRYVHWRDRQEKVPVYRTDCSGFSYLVYRLANVGTKLINRDDDDQSHVGKLLTWNDFKAGKFRKGDLVFFWTSKKGDIGHVGIYIGDKKIIHNAGINKDVIISDISSRWYSDRFMVARRVLY